MQEKRKQIYILMSSCGIQLVEEVTNKKVVGASSEETVFLRKQMERSLKVMGLSQNTIQNQPSLFSNWFLHYFKTLH